MPRAERPEAGGGDHRGVVGRQRQAREKCRHFALFAALLHVGAQTAVRRHAAGHADALRAVAPRRREQALHERVYDDALKARGGVGDVLVRERPLVRPHLTEHRGLQAAEAEIEIALQLRRVAVGVREAGGGQRDRAIVAAFGEPIDHRPARIAEAEQPRHLVVRLPRRIVTGPAQDLVRTRPLDEIEAGVAAGDDQHDRGQRQLAVLQDERLDVAGEMMHGDERPSGGRGGGLGERHADQQRSDQAGALRHRNRAEIAPGRFRLAQRAIDDAADVADVLSRRELGHDTAPLLMDRHLRGDDVGPDRPGPGRIAGFVDDRSGRLVARGFDTQDQHRTAVTSGFPAIPPSSPARTPPSAFRCREPCRCLSR